MAKKTQPRINRNPPAGVSKPNIKGTVLPIVKIADIQ
jgi:hypothetical protein